MPVRRPHPQRCQRWDLSRDDVIWVLGNPQVVGYNEEDRNLMLVRSEG